jgi:hypothetical protein
VVKNGGMVTDDNLDRMLEEKNREELMVIRRKFDNLRRLSNLVKFV